MFWRTSLVVFAAVLLVAGCGKTAPEPGNPGHKANDPAHRLADLGGGVRVVSIPWEGQRVKCLKWDDYSKGGLACDFEAFHHQYGYHSHFYDNPSGATVGG